jgi:hypothetical protein
MTKKLMVLCTAALFLLSACAGSTPVPKSVPPTDAGEPYPGGAYPPVELPVDTGTYPDPGQVVIPVDNSAYPAPGQGSPYDPQASDAALQRAEVTVDPASSEILLLESFPVQVVARLIIAMPTPCHQPRVKVNAPDAQGNIALEVYAVVDPNTICTQVIAQIEVRVSLGALSSGTYQVLINGEAFKSITID